MDRIGSLDQGILGSAFTRCYRTFLRMWIGISSLLSMCFLFRSRMAALLYTLDFIRTYPTPSANPAENSVHTLVASSMDGFL